MSCGRGRGRGVRGAARIYKFLRTWGKLVELVTSSNNNRRKFYRLYILILIFPLHCTVLYRLVGWKVGVCQLNGDKFELVFYLIYIWFEFSSSFFLYSLNNKMYKTNKSFWKLIRIRIYWFIDWNSLFC